MTYLALAQERDRCSSKPHRTALLCIVLDCMYRTAPELYRTELYYAEPSKRCRIVCQSISRSVGRADSQSDSRSVGRPKTLAMQYQRTRMFVPSLKKGMATQHTSRIRQHLCNGLQNDPSSLIVIDQHAESFAPCLFIPSHKGAR